MASWTRSTEMIGRAITRGHKQLGLGEMSKGGIFDLASGVGGKIDKADVLSSVDEWKGESLQESLKRHQHFVALQLNLKPGQTVLDVGCGIGGPLREIARFSRTKVTGLNNNEYQITRAKVLNREVGLEETCDFVKVGCYKEIYRVLKPGQCFVADEWCLTDSYIPDSSEHQKIKVVWEKDLAEDSHIPWYLPLDTSHFSVSSFHLTAVGRQGLECVGIAPKGSRRVYDFLEISAEGLVAGAKKGIFTPTYFIVVRKPISASE
nr:cycloartenol-C-24-methyltransferase [Ipomoea batatas]